MIVSQYVFTRAEGWSPLPVSTIPMDFVIVFGGVDLLSDAETFPLLRERFPVVPLILVSTAGEIAQGRVLDASLVCTAIKMERTEFRIISEAADEHPDSLVCGQQLAKQLRGEGLCHVLVLSEGTYTNGDQLIRGLRSVLDDEVLITGGLAGDAGRFSRTVVGYNEPARSARLVAIGFYGSKLRVAHGTQGGWDPFGPVREVTRSSGNVLYELDGRNALELYKMYLGDRAPELPGAALLFPLCIFSEGNSVVRTILGIDESTGSMTFAGDIPSGARAQFMMANFDRLIDGASAAATDSFHRLNELTPDLVIMVSCVGRKIVLGPRTEEEVDSVLSVFGPDPTYAGFYSNGEISPLQDGVGCSLHNQTMTITTYLEVP